jgi:hypothetical protein
LDRRWRKHLLRDFYRFRAAGPGIAKGGDGRKKQQDNEIRHQKAPAPMCALRLPDPLLGVYSGLRLHQEISYFCPNSAGVVAQNFSQCRLAIHIFLL